ncbi:MAG TPA: threonine/serine dehydratase [Polyangiaceae bacterium]|nr:threonine/serine dehydratase [Polyangiaceae bacterium]
MIALAEIRAAAQNIAGKVHRTPLLSSSQLAGPTGVRLHLKCESFQKTGSFKARGALNKILSLSADERARGLVTVSAGNHAAAVAWSARIAGCSAVVVMPVDAPKSKIDAVRGYGAEIVAHPDRATLFDKLEELRVARGLTFVHPFDDPAVLAGAGTVGVEIAEELEDLELVIVPVGGGGLLSGVASAIKQLNARVRVVAVELEAGPGLGPSLAAGRPIPVKRPDTLADGMTPPFVGALPLAIAREAVDEIVTVTETEIIDAMKLLMTRAKLYVEASGAAATAALLAGKVRAPQGQRTVAIVSGGNVDLARIAALV